MNMETDFRLLLHKQWTGALTGAEAEALQSWLNSDPSHATEAARLKQVWEAGLSYKSTFVPDSQKALAALRQRLPLEKSAPKRRILQPWRIAAAVVALVGLAAVWQLVLRPDKTSWVTVNQNTTLPDGSRVWLREGSTLSYPTTFPARQRPVKLEGEAFFEVESDARAPFVVSTPSGEVEVLGTSFNIRAYPEGEMEEVFVQTGKVSYTVASNTKVAILAPYQKAVFNRKTGELVPVSVKSANATSWKTGVLEFRDAPLREYIEALEDYFGIDFDSRKLKIPDCPITTNLDHPELDDVLYSLQSVFGIRIDKTVAGIYILSGGTCP